MDTVALIAGAALAAKRGDQKVSDLKGPSKSMYESMSERELDEMASSKRKGKPQHASKRSEARRRGQASAWPRDAADRPKRLCLQLIAERQRADALAGRIEDRVVEGRRERRHARLADAGRMHVERMLDDVRVDDQR